MRPAGLVITTPCLPSYVYAQPSSFTSALTQSSVAGLGLKLRILLLPHTPAVGGDFQADKSASSRRKGIQQPTASTSTLPPLLQAVHVMIVGKENA